MKHTLNEPARRVDPDRDIGGGHAGMPSPAAPHPALVVLAVGVVCCFIAVVVAVLAEWGVRT